MVPSSLHLGAGYQWWKLLNNRSVVPDMAIGIVGAQGCNCCVVDILQKKCICGSFSAVTCISTSLPPPTTVLISVMGACLPCCMGAQDWVARIPQPWKQSSSWSWLPIVEAAGCLTGTQPLLVTHLFNRHFCNHLFFATIKLHLYYF